MISGWHSRIAGIALAVLASTVGASSYMDGDSMKHGDAGLAVTHCLGRHLLELPAGSRVDARFTVGGANVSTRKGVSSSGFREIVTARAAALAQQPHSQAASRFVGRHELADDRVLLTSWLSPNSVRMYLTELYGFFPAGGVMHVFAGETSVKLDHQTRAYFSSLAQTVRLRSEGEIPAEAGFCIDSGLVMRSALNQEEVTTTIRVPDRPGVTLTYQSHVTGKPDAELLSRVSRVPPGYEGAVASMKTLRRGPREIGPIPGQELLVRSDAGSKRGYEFLWESQGQRGSIEHPFLSLRLTTTDESDANGEILDAPFSDDAEALEFWDAILASLRLRPGAV